MAYRFGLHPLIQVVDLKKVIDHVQKVIEETYSCETPEILREKGLEVEIGSPSFIDPNTLQVNNQEINAKHFLICTGARPRVPEIPGLEDVEYHTYKTIFLLRTLPENLLVLGGGPVGCELGQAFSRLGSKVTIIVRGSRLLEREDPEASKLLKEVFQREGIGLRFNVEVARAWKDNQDIHLQCNNERLTGKVLLVATGRKPSLDSLKLENARVKYNSDGILVDKNLRTSQKYVYAAGDCIALNPQHTHYAGWQGFIAAKNAIFPDSNTELLPSVPATTFTDHEVASTGLMDEDTRKKHMNVSSYLFLMKEVDRAKTDRNLDGFIKLVFTDDETFIGATVVGARAGETIQEWIAVINDQMSVEDVANQIHIYSTYSFGNQKAAFEYVTENFLSSSEGKIAKLLTRIH